jgi:hypothetical protein
MNIDYSHFWLQKAGNLASEYEDDFFPYKYPFEINPHDDNPKYQRYIIADGASTAYLSRLWARTLVDEFGLYESEISNENFLDLVQTLVLDKKWNDRLADHSKKRDEEGKPLSWYDEMALQNGAASTLLEISFALEENRLKNKFSALAIGDSCLFQVRNDELITKFPLNSSADFDNFPILISSDPKQNLNLQEKIAYLDDLDATTGDQILLMTDALASWFLQEYEKGERPWKVIRKNVVNNSSFLVWVEKLRENKLMRNDDVTLMILKIQGETET